ncbi:B4 isoform X1 [Pelobates cultripes]|uniref:B4 isoform X1 n=1 Tax=Pelobates cultripes TaxID=61616 RepID=A0AAD1SX64_PELCU|nr:B4 isoform X1 [Pelobates cultripes]
MAPKKAVPPTEVKEKETAPAPGECKVKAKAKRRLSKLVMPLGHPSTLSMVIEALKKDSERKGTSVPAIRTRILAAHPTVDPMRLKFLLRTALNKGIEKGILIRPLNSSAKGATGRFKLAKGEKKPTTQKKKMSENIDPNAEEKPIKKTTKKAKVAKGEKTDKVEKAEPKKDVKKPAAKKDGKEKAVKATASKKPKATTPAEGAKPKKVPAKKEPKAGASKEPSTAEGPAPKNGKKVKK